MNDYLPDTNVGDLISREDALDCFHDWVDKYGDVHTADEMVEYQRIEALPAVQGWIPVSERLPKKGQMVIVTLEEAIDLVDVGFIGHEGWCGVDLFPMIATPIAWMPLPEPYKEEE